MPTLTSTDGTTIAFTVAGAGPALVLVDGAMCYRGMGPMDALAEQLTGHFTVYTYDRRRHGRGRRHPVRRISDAARPDPRRLPHRAGPYPAHLLRGLIA